MTVDPVSLESEITLLKDKFDMLLPQDDGSGFGQAFNEDALADLRGSLDHLVEEMALLPPWDEDHPVLNAVEIAADNLFLALKTDLVPRLNRVIQETIPVPDLTQDRASAEAMAKRATSPVAIELYQIISANCQRLTGHIAPRAWHQDLERRLEHDVHYFQNEINTILKSPDPPDIRNLAADLLRMDVLYWILVDLDLETVAETLKANEKVTARLILNSAADAVEAYLETPDDLNRFDLAIVLTAIDDLIAVMERVLDDHIEDMSRPHDGFFESRGREAITRFVTDMGKLMVWMFQDLTDLARAGTLTYRQFEMNVAKVERIYQFCDLVDPLTEGSVHKAADKILRVRSKQLVEDLTGLAKTEGADTETITRSLVRLQETLKTIGL